MKVNTKQYAQTLFSLVEGETKEKSLKIIENFARFLVKNNDAFRLEKIEKDFISLWDKERSILKVEIVSANELPVESENLLINYIKNKIGAKEINITRKLDKAILGGVIIKYGDKIFDASLRSRLDKLKETISA